jgi:YD repeat-containing protein
MTANRFVPAITAPMQRKNQNWWSSIPWTHWDKNLFGPRRWATSTHITVTASFTISGFSKVTNPNPKGGIYGYIVETYKGTSKQETFTFHFDRSKSHDWQHKTAQIQTSKPFDNLKVYYEYSQQAGKAWFDTAKVMVGSITTTHTYDSRGNYETKTTDPQGRTIETTYDDDLGNVLTEKIGTQTTSYGYDGADRLTQVTDAQSGITKYEYDLNGNKTKVTNANNHTTTIR